MHNTVNYTKLPQPEREKQALADVTEWLNQKQYQALTDLIRNKPDTTLEQFAFYMSFCGVQGYPVEVFYNFIKQNP